MMASPACGSPSRPTSGSSATTPKWKPRCGLPSRCSPRRAPTWRRSIRGSRIRCEAFKVLWDSGIAKVLQGYGDIREGWADRVDPGLRRTAATGSTYSASDYLDATAARMELGTLMGSSTRATTCSSRRHFRWPRSPSGRTCRTAGDRRTGTSWTPYTYPFNLTQQPALSVPCGFTSAGLPIGLQVVGPRHADALVLRVGQRVPDRHRLASRTPLSQPRRFDEQVRHGVAGQARSELRGPVARQRRTPDMRGRLGFIAVVGSSVSTASTPATRSTRCYRPSLPLIRVRRTPR